MSEHAPEAPRTAGALIRRTLGRRRRLVLGSAALVTVWQVAELMVPVLIGLVIDDAVVTGDLRAMGLWAVALPVQFVVLSLSYRFGARLGVRALHEESHALRTEVSAHVLSPVGARTGLLPGDVLSIATTDAEMVATVVRQVTFTIAAAVGLVVSAIVLAAIDVVLAVLVLVGVPAVLTVIQLLSPRLARRSEVRQDALGVATGLAADFVRGIRPLKGVGAEEAALARYRLRSRNAVDASIGAARWEGLMHGMTDGLSGLFLAVVAVVAGVRAVEGELAVGELVAVVGVSQFLGEPMRMLTYLVAQLAQSRGSAGRVVSFLATPPLVTSSAPVDCQADADRDGDQCAVAVVGQAPALELDRVTFGSLTDVSFTAEPGRLVAVAADAPADAAAVMTLLRGEAVPDSGSVLLAGAPLTALPIGRARSVLLVNDHHVDLFEGTVLSNVDPTGRLAPERLRDVLCAAAADEVVDHLPTRLQEHVRADGTAFSGGQRQRLGLARALAADPPVLVLHDPTTAVDAVTEARIAAGLHRQRHGQGHGEGAAVRTTVVLTNSPALLARADTVVHLTAGRVVACGRHGDLLGQDAYRAAVLR